MYVDTIQEPFGKPCTTKRDLQNLYAKPEFRLIQVTKDQDPDVPPRMRLVCPAKDAAARQDLLSREKGYYCISHCWGPEEELMTWNDSNIVGVHGEPLPVQIRSKKCETLLRLLETRGGYWWIDIFCSHRNYGDPPLEFMDDIYRHCKQCFALLDCPKDAIDTVASHIPGGWSFINISLRNKKEVVVKKYFKYLKNNNNASNTLDILIKLMVETVYPEFREGFAPAVSRILRCSWYSRVWTLQEAMLPYDTVLMAEDITSSGSVSYRSLVIIVEQVQGAAIIAEKRLAAVRPKRSIGPRSSCMKYFTMQPVIPAIDRARKLFKYVKLLKFTVGDAYYPLLLLTLSMTKRQCQYERDYIFGVLGILGIRLPFTEDLKVLWKTFLETLKPLLPKHSKLPWHYDLAKAPSFDNVFASFNPKKLLDQTSRWKHVSTFFLLPSQ